MEGLIWLRDLELVPALELEPGRFSTRERPRPSGSGLEMPMAWDRYWLDCLADSGITGLNPLRPASWHVPVRALDQEVLGKLLRTPARDGSSIEARSVADESPALD